LEEELSLQPRPQLTWKQLGFINDVDLRNDLRARLDELDRVVLANAHYSTVFLAIGTVEGIFRHVAEIYTPEIRSSATYPHIGVKQPKPKAFDKLTIDELYAELRTLGIAPQAPDYKALYELFRHYRNCIHPQARVGKGWEIGLGQAQMALGLLNATLQNLDRNVFIGKHRFEKIAGSPDYDDDGVLRLPLNGTPHRSFVLLRDPISGKCHIRFDLHLSPKSLLNFVFNYAGDGDFKMVRLDGRPDKRYANGVLVCSQKYRWAEILTADPKKPPESEQFPVEISIDVRGGVFDFTVNGSTYKFVDKKGHPKALALELRPGLRVGFFNEVNSVRLSSILIEN
jgi:hypothetical protein